MNCFFADKDGDGSKGPPLNVSEPNVILEEGEGELEVKMRCIICQKELQTFTDSWSEIISCLSGSSETKLADLLVDLVNPVHAINFTVRRFDKNVFWHNREYFRKKFGLHVENFLKLIHWS